MHPLSQALSRAVRSGPARCYSRRDAGPSPGRSFDPYRRYVLTGNPDREHCIADRRAAGDLHDFGDVEQPAYRRDFDANPQLNCEGEIIRNCSMPIPRSLMRSCSTPVTRVYRAVAGHGQYIDASIHEACTDNRSGDRKLRLSGRGGAVSDRTSSCSRPSAQTYVPSLAQNWVRGVLVAGRLTPKYIGELADLLDKNGMAGDLRDPKYQDPAFIAANTSHIIDDLPISSPACRQKRSITPLSSAASLGGRCVPLRRY